MLKRSMKITCHYDRSDGHGGDVLFNPRLAEIDQQEIIDKTIEH
jgi:hypothetical protein